ncbi:MAG: phosphoribosylformylglycinamidine cyclo-ligase [Deltaproteobacteria bacterium]|nr:phosphoribosylformylglycinamidine cyclo-ligase [Deltaproteobacteria bacterium]
MANKAESSLYEKRGVSSQKTEIHEAIANADPGLFPGAFCKVLPDSLSMDSNSCLLMHSDGAGTKSSLAYLYWRETGDLSVFKGIAVDSLIMNLDDLACVGALDRFLLTNSIGRNKFYISGEIIKEIIDGFDEAIELLESLGIHMKLCGGETADVGDLVRTIILDSTLIARVKRKEIIDLDNVRPGDQIVGFASFGQAKWEEKYNSGIGSNGLTAARHDCLSQVYAGKYPESFSPEIPGELVYCGPGKLDDPLKGTPLNLGQALLSPTRTYTPLIKRLQTEFAGRIHGYVHCTGGGQTKCLKFGRQIHYIKNNLFDLPPIFSYIRDTKNHALRDLFPVYNMGHRLEAFMEKDIAGEAVKLAQDSGIEARIIGECQKSDRGENQLTINFEGQKIRY